MGLPILPLRVHQLLLCVYALFMMTVWMLPVLLAGYPYMLTMNIVRARELAETGLLVEDNMRLTVVIIRLLHAFIAWDAVLLWTSVSVGAMAVALMPWWGSVRRLFGMQVAWVSTILLSFLPLYWLEAIRLEGYTFCLLFLFLGFFFWTVLFPRHRVWAMLLTGLCMGATVASRDSFLVLLPWCIVAYVWHERSRWKRAVAEMFLCCLAAYIAFALPLLPNAMRSGMSPAERVSVFLPSLAHSTPGTGHIYPDDYTYQFLRAEFEERYLQKVKDHSFVEEIADVNYRSIFGIGEVGVGSILMSSIWLFVNSLPEFFFFETMGGALVWVFIIIGGAVLYRRNRFLLLSLIGLWCSMEILLRFVLHFSRSHLLSIAWGLALLAGLGIIAAADAGRRQWKLSFSTSSCVAVLIVLTIVQCVQASRKQFAALYARSTVPMAYAAGQALAHLSPEAIVAHPRKTELFFFADRKNVSIHADTVSFLAERGGLAEPFRHYGVSHILGYDAEQAALIRRAVPGIRDVPLAANPFPPPSPFVRYLLHIIR